MKRDKPDSQRRKVYRAEQDWRNFGWIGVVSRPPVRFGCLEQADDYVKLALSKVAIRRRYPKATAAEPPKLVQGRAGTSAWAQRGRTISLPGWALTDITVLHELAHIICWHEFGEPGTEEVRSHGWQFAKCMIDLVWFCIGKPAGIAFRDIYKGLGVKYKPPKKMKPLSPEKKAILRQRVADARKRKDALAA